MTIRIVGVSGSPTSPSRTTGLVTAVVDALAAAFGPGVDSHRETIELSSLVGPLFGGPQRRDLGEATERALVAVETADVIVAGSPAYRASYTGLFKHFFDYIGQYALVDTPVVLAATGGSDRHALLVEHQMRPLFGFFQALTLPLGIFGNENDFTEYRVSSPDLQDRITQSTARAIPLISYQLRDGGRLGPVGEPLAG